MVKDEVYRELLKIYHDGPQAEDNPIPVVRNWLNTHARERGYRYWQYAYADMVGYDDSEDTDQA